MVRIFVILFKLLSIVVSSGLLLAPPAFAQESQRSAIQPDPVEQHFKAAQTFQLAGDFEKAAAEYRQAIAGALDHLGNLRMAKGQSSEGIELLENAVQIEPEYLDGRIDLAIAYFHIGDLGKSRSAVEAVLKKENHNFRALNLLGKIHFMEGNFQAAAEALQAALKLQPDFDVAYTLALADLNLKNSAEAGVLFDEMLASMKASPELRSLIGIAYRETGYLDQAVNQFEKVIELDPKYPRTHSALALTYLLQGPRAYAAAREQFRAELAITPDDYTSHYFLGVIELEEHRPAEAVKWLKEAARLQAAEPDPLFNLGRALFEEGRMEQAAIALKKSIALTTDRTRTDQVTQAHNLLGQALDKLGRKEESVAEIAKAQQISQSRASGEKKTGPDAVTGDSLAGQVGRSGQQGLRTMLARAPAKPDSDGAHESEYVNSIAKLLGESYHNLGVIDARASRYTDATSEFSQAGHWNSKIEGLDRNWGIAAFRANLYDQAVGPLERQLKRNPEDMTIREMLGMSYFMTDKFENSAKLLGPIGDRLPNDPGLLYAAGASLVRSGNPAEGEKLITRMLEQNANVPEVHLMLGEAHAQQGEPEEALAEFSRALQLKPRLPEAHYYSGMVRFKQGKMDEAAQEFQAELGINPQYVPAKYQLAYVRLTQHQIEDAVRLLRDVVAQKPAYADAYYQLGKAMLEKGDVKAAIQNLETAVRLQPSADYNYYQLSLAYRRDGRLDDAQHALQNYETLKAKKREANKPSKQP